MAFQFALLADVRDVLRGTRDVEEALDDTADALDGLEDSSSDASRALRDDLEKIGKEADDTADKTERSFKDAFDTVKRESDDAGRKTRDSFDDASKGAEDFKDEASSSAREGAASFSGEFEDVADFIQETLANALEGFGPVGAAAGLAAAAGIGILVSTLQASADKAEESKERVVDLADQIREVDGDLSRLDLNQIFLDWSGEISDTKQWFELWQDAPKTQIEQLATASDELGVSLDFLRAALQDVDGPEAQRVAELLNERLGTGVNAVAGSTDEATQALINLRTELAEGNLDIEKAAELYGLQNEALDEHAAKLDYVRESTETYRESVAGALEEAGDSWEQYTEDGVVNLDAYADAMERQIESVQRYEENMTTASKTLTDEALGYLQNMGVEAAPLLQAFVDAPLDEQQRLAGIWDTLGQSAVTGYSDGVAGLTDATNDAVSTATDNADPVEIKYTSSSWDAQKVVNDSLSRVASPIVKIRYTSTNPAGVGYRRA